jgi:hypothetical protein
MSRKERGARWRTWLKLCAKSWEIAGSIPDEVFGISFLP